jgi:hypothetical protein
LSYEIVGRQVSTTERDVAVTGALRTLVNAKALTQAGSWSPRSYGGRRRNVVVATITLVDQMVRARSPVGRHGAAGIVKLINHRQTCQLPVI